MQRVKGSVCPGCGAMLDAASHHEEGAVPEPGCFSICLYCGLLLRFDDDLSLGPIDPAELNCLSLEQERELIVAKFVVKSFWAERIKRN